MLNTISVICAPQFEDRAGEFLLRMTLREKAGMLSGRDDWYLKGVERLGIPSIRVTDCGHGVALCGDISSPGTCFPTGIGMAATWDVELLERAGRVLGRECRAVGCSILLGPKVNLHRHPLNGRSFETFSEDPWLAGLLGAALIRGIQEEGVGACVKAFCANNQQTGQETISSEVEERVLREMYLRVFQIAVEDGRPCAVMTAYNKVNGEYCAESPWLIRKIIKDEWSFPGFVVSDWRSVHGPEVYAGGLDLEMPGPGTFLSGDAVCAALEEGLMSEADLNERVRRILNVVLRYGKEAVPVPELMNTEESRRVALEVAEGSIVLLKNANGALPLDSGQLRRILVAGPNAAHARLGGGGSASVTPFYAISPLEGIREICGGKTEVLFMEGCGLVGSMQPLRGHFAHVAGDGVARPGLIAEFFDGLEPEGLPSAVNVVEDLDFSWGWAAPASGVAREHFSVRFHGVLIPPETGRYRLGIYAQEGCVQMQIRGVTVAESWDDAKNGNFEEAYKTHHFTIEQDFEKGCPVPVEIRYAKRAARAAVRLEWERQGHADSLAAVVRAAQHVDAVILCVGLSNLFEGGGRDRLSLDLPSIQCELIRRVADANPRTIVALNSGGIVTMPWEPAVPAILQSWYPGQEGGRALAKILFGLTNPSGCLPDTLPRRMEDHAALRDFPGKDRVVRYEEGLYIGYRHFDRERIAPHYPFGFGLSYTQFAFDPPQLSREKIRAGEEVHVTMRVRNTGSLPGKVVVQLYIRPLDAPVDRPEKELRGFRKTHLEVGETALLLFRVGTRELEYFDEFASAWTVSGGRYEILVGPHSGDLSGVVLEVSPAEAAALPHCRVRSANREPLPQ